MRKLYTGPKDLAESLQALEDVGLPSDAHEPLAAQLCRLDDAQEPAEVEHRLDEAGGLIAGLQGSHDQAQRLTRIFDALASHARQALAAVGAGDE